MKPNSTLIKLLAIFWAALCIAIFIGTPGRASYIHWSTLTDWKSFFDRLGRIEPISYSTNLFLAVIGIALFSSACVSFGSLFIKMLHIHEKDNSTSTLSAWLGLLGTAFLIGHGLFSLIFLAFASLYQLTPLNAAVILIIGALLGASSIGKVFPSPFRLSRLKSYENEYSKSEKRLLLFIIGILVFSLFYTSARQSYDASAIYFSDAKISALTNRAEYFTDDTFVVSVLQSTIQYTALIQLFGDQAARMFSWISGLVIIFFSIALGEKVGLSRKARLLLMVFLLSSTAYLDLMGDGKVDLISSAPAIATAYWMVAGEQNKSTSRSLLLLIGCLAGLAIVARPFNAFLIGLFILFFYAQKAFLQNSYKTVMYPFLWIGIGITGFGAYHLLANWVILGGPFAFLSSVSNINSTSGPWDFDPQRIMFLRLLYPIAATFVNTPQSLGNITPLFLAFSPIVLIPTIRKRISITKELTTLLITSSIILLLWIFLFFTVLEIRYVMFLWIILFMPLAEITAAALEDTDRLVFIASNGLIFIFLCFISLRTLYISVDTYSPLDKQSNPQCDKSRFCEYLQSINRLALRGDRVLTLSAFRYYLRTDLFACSTSHKEYQRLQIASKTGPLDFWEEVYRQGYKYVAYENDYTTRHLQFAIIPSPENTPDWMELEPIFGKPGDLQVAYKINVANPPFKSKTKCQKSSSGIWDISSLMP